MIKMSWEEALAKYGDTLWLASLGAIPKSDNTFRIIHDGAHATGVNGCITVRDQLAVPTAGDLRQACKELERPTFVLTTDVSRAHHLVNIRECDWGYQARKSSKQSAQ